MYGDGAGASGTSSWVARPDEEPVSRPDAGGRIQGVQKSMETPIERITLNDIPVGGRLLVRSKKDWRVAVVARKTEEFVSISIASPSGYNYRIRRDADQQIFLDGLI